MQVDSVSEGEDSEGDEVSDGDVSEEVLVLVGISSCLLGEMVRYNGVHRKAALLVAELTPHVRWLPVCPEVEVGMGVPREPVHLVERDVEREQKIEGELGTAGSCRLVGVETGRDWTRDMEEFAASCTLDLEKQGVSGYIFKSRSPSCGLRSVPIHAAENAPKREGPGLFAAAVRARFPDLPVAEESDLVDAASCRAFLRRVLEYRRGRR